MCENPRSSVSEILKPPIKVIDVYIYVSQRIAIYSISTWEIKLGIYWLDILNRTYSTWPLPSVSETEDDNIGYIYRVFIHVKQHNQRRKVWCIRAWEREWFLCPFLAMRNQLITSSEISDSRQYVAHLGFRAEMQLQGTFPHSWAAALSRGGWCVNGYQIELTAASLTLTHAAGINSSRTSQAELGRGEQHGGIKNLAGDVAEKTAESQKMTMESWLH